MAVVYLGIGSNLGDREMHLTRAIAGIEAGIGSVIKSSRIYESEPVGFESGHRFLNQCVCVETTLSPDELMTGILEIESSLGRIRADKGYADRTLDMDVLLFDGLVIHTHRLVVPHPRLHQRRFVLQPLSEIAARVFHPVLGLSIQELLDICTDNNNVSVHKGMGSD